MEDAYTARQATKILHMSGRVELEARKTNPAAVGQKSLCNGPGTTAGHPLR
ncbi:MAG TPA: hypothetical protein VKA82_09075 [Rubrobacter sp.]|nr:hypothetical protein [Rubrobacter sp.]